MLVLLESSSAVLVMISSTSESICNRSHARRANCSKITISLVVPLFDALIWWHEICSQETRDSMLSCGIKLVSLPHLGLIWYRVVTPGQTDRQTDGQTERITIASTHLALPAVVCTNHMSVCLWSILQLQFLSAFDKILHSGLGSWK